MWRIEFKSVQAGVSSSENRLLLRPKRSLSSSSLNHLVLKPSSPEPQAVSFSSFSHIIRPPQATLSLSCECASPHAIYSSYHAFSLSCHLLLKSFFVLTWDRNHGRNICLTCTCLSFAGHHLCHPVVHSLPAVIAGHRSGCVHEA